MAKEVRLSDIGEKLGVSTVTVSKALSGQKGVSEEMRAKIARLAEEMGYVKSAGNEDEKTRQSHTIGIIVAERYLKENQSFYWKIYQEISQRAMARNCFSMLEVISYDVESTNEMPKIISENKVEGVIIMGAYKQEYVNFLLDNVKIPVMNLDSTCGGDRCDSVVSNNLMGGYIMTNHLFEMGHREIGFVGTRLATSSIDDRFLGYLKSMMEHGETWNKEWWIDDRDRDLGSFDAETGFLFPEQMPTAFFCNCDLSASMLIKQLVKMGYRVPEDISVVGFDNYLNDQFAGVGITTYEINTREMARRAVHILMHKLENSNYTTGMFMLPGTFVERDSVKQVGQPVPFV